MTRYLIRIDDVHDRMRRERFSIFYNLLRKYGVNPIVGVIPDNLDSSIVRSERDPDFLNFLQSIQRDGASIAIHGFNHLYCTTDSGLLGINDFSEFAGLSYTEQRSKIESSIEFFRDNGLNHEIFMAPAHSFDDTTLQVLSDCGILYVTDSFFAYPQRYGGVHFIPQQLWRPRRMFVPGCFTICYHLDSIDDEEFNVQLEILDAFLEKHHSRFVDFYWIRDEFRSGTVKKYYSYFFRFLFSICYSAKKLYKNIRKIC